MPTASNASALRRARGNVVKRSPRRAALCGTKQDKVYELSENTPDRTQKKKRVVKKESAKKQG